MSTQGADENQEQGSEQENQDTTAEETQTGSDTKSDKTPDIEQIMKDNAKYRAKIRELKPLAEKWTEKENSEKSEAQLLKEQLEKLQEDNVTNLKTAIAARAGLPEKLVPLLTGTKEEMESQARTLAEEFGGKPATQSRPTPVLRTGQTGSDSSQDVNNWLRQLAGK